MGTGRRDFRAPVAQPRLRACGDETGRLYATPGGAFADATDRPRHQTRVRPHATTVKTQGAIMNVINFSLLMVGVLLNAGAQLLLKAGTNSVGMFEFSRANIMPVGCKLATEPHIIG